MLQRRQHIPPYTPPLQPATFVTDYSEQLSTLSAQEVFNQQKLLHDYLDSQQQPFANPVIVDDDLEIDPSQYMTGAFDLVNPTIRIQQSTPTPQMPSGFSQPPMLSANNATAGLNNWTTFANNGQSLQTPIHSRAGAAHQRAASSSSIGSTGSQYPASTYSSFSNNHLPTPTHTPTQDSFLNPNFNNYTPNTTGMDTTMSAHFSMKQALMDGMPEEEVPGFGHSARHSVSSYGQDSPATPHTTHGDEFEEKFKAPSTDMRRNFNMDDVYNPNMVSQIPHSTPQTNATSNASLLSPYRTSNDVQRVLQLAQNARSQSPSSSVSSGVSPFRQNSPYRAPGNNFNSPRMKVGAAAQVREAQKVEADAYTFRQQEEEAQPKTISPKDALLDYREADDEAKVPLFPDGGASEYEPQYSSGDQYRNATQSSYDTTSKQSYRGDSWATSQFSPNFSTTTSSPAPPQSTFNFVPPSISGNLHGLPYSSQQYRSSTSNMPSAAEQTPEFPAHLTSMESSASEAGPDTNSAPGEHIQKPASSNADTGTYTCTYHGCTLRFETPQKLQKHKREGHRNANAANIGSTMTSAALLERNSQAGPHKCERINPTTGKPCNTIFSRPYDLTRHEDTIHNARKQKVRCALCVEEKTFSRNDALTRHMRVVHPDVDFPGKHRRRGGNHD